MARMPGTRAEPLPWRCARSPTRGSSCWRARAGRPRFEEIVRRYRAGPRGVRGGHRACPPRRGRRPGVARPRPSPRFATDGRDSSALALHDRSQPGPQRPPRRAGSRAPRREDRRRPAAARDVAAGREELGSVVDADEGASRGAAQGARPAGAGGQEPRGDRRGDGREPGRGQAAHIPRPGIAARGGLPRPHTTDQVRGRLGLRRGRSRRAWRRRGHRPEGGSDPRGRDPGRRFRRGHPRPLGRRRPSGDRRHRGPGRAGSRAGDGRRSPHRPSRGQRARRRQLGIRRRRLRRRRQRPERQLGTRGRRRRVQFGARG